MTIGKYIKYPLQKTRGVVLGIHNTVMTSYKGVTIDQFKGMIHTVDSTYSFDNLEEFTELVSTNMGKITIVYTPLRYRLSDGGEITIDLTHSNEDPYVDLKCGGLKPEELEELFASFKDRLFKVNYYKHLPAQAAKETQKAVADKARKILEATDDLQVRSLAIIQNEKDFQNFLYPILRSHFDDLEDEHYLPKYALKTYQPDFGIPSGKLLIEAKFIKTKANLKRVQSELHDDVIGYLGSSDKYNKVIVAIYNFGNIAINKEELKQLEKAKGIISVIVCNHVIPNNLEDKK